MNGHYHRSAICCRTNDDLPYLNHISFTTFSADPLPVVVS